MTKSKQMLLAVDIGNTNIKMALFKGEKILRSFRFVTDKDITLKQWQHLLRKLFTQKKVKNTNAIEEIIICSVSPRLTVMFKKALSILLKIRPLILGKDIIAPIKNLYKKPEQVGQDRLANAVAATEASVPPSAMETSGPPLTYGLTGIGNSHGMGQS